MGSCYGAITIIVVLLISSIETIARKSNPTPLERLQFLAPQNTARSVLGLSPLKWDVRLAKYATNYAISRESDCALKHSGGTYGENIFWGGGSEWTPNQAADAWVSERKWYNYQTNSCASGQQCGHYTQIVSRNTSKVGCARAICLGGKGVFMTCNYDPPGNYIGQRPY